MTTDGDAVIHSSSAMKDAINRVSDKFGLPAAWLNSDFTKISSYSAKLDEVSIYYRTFSNVLMVRTVSAEYLIAMKLRSGRRYKNDLSDIIGILSEHQKRNSPLTRGKISAAVIQLYGSWDAISANSKTFIEDLFTVKDYGTLYEKILANEQEARDALISFDRNYPGIAGQSNVDDILSTLEKKR